MKRIRRLDKSGLGALRAWKVEDAKARFSELVRRARADGPQRVTYRGKDAVVVIDIDDLRSLLPEGGDGRSLIEFLRGSALGELDMTRPPDRGRNVEL